MNPTTNAWSSRSPKCNFTFIDDTNYFSSQPSLTASAISPEAAQYPYSATALEMEFSDTALEEMPATMDPEVFTYILREKIKGLEKELRREQKVMDELLAAPFTAPSILIDNRSDGDYDAAAPAPSTHSERKDDGPLSPPSSRAHIPSARTVLSTAPFTPPSIAVDFASDAAEPSTPRAHTPSIGAIYLNNSDVDDNAAAPSPQHGVVVALGAPQPVYGDESSDDSSTESGDQTGDQASSTPLNYSQSSTESSTVCSDDVYSYACSDSDYEYLHLTKRQTIGKIYNIWAAANAKCRDEASDSEYTDSHYSDSTETKEADSGAHNGGFDDGGYDIVESVEFLVMNRGRFPTMVSMPNYDGDSEDEIEATLPDLDDLWLLSGGNCDAALVRRGHTVERFAQIPLFDSNV